jgi:hypothetical protein
LLAVMNEYVLYTLTMDSFSTLPVYYRQLDQSEATSKVAATPR